MKQRNRILALLMALCLAVSVLVVPASAADLAQMKAQLEEARTTLASKQQELSNVQNANRALEEEKANAQTAVYNAEIALAKAESNFTGVDSSNERYEELKKAKDDAARELEVARGRLSHAEEAAKGIQDTTSLEDEVKTANSLVTQLEEEIKKAEEEAAANSEAELKKKLTPGTGDLSFSVSYVDLGTLAKDATSGRSKSFSITNRSSLYVMYLSCSNPSGYTVSGVPSTLAPGSSATVTVYLDSTATEGTYNRTLQISGYYQDNGVQGSSQTFSLPLYAVVGGKGLSLSVDPSTKDLGKLAEGYDDKAAKEKEITVTVENKGVSSLQMNGVKGSDHFTVTAVKTENETLKSGEKTDYKVVPKKDLAVGTYTDTITFQTKEGATAALKATVVVEKKLASLSVEPAALNFGTLEEGYAAPAPQTVTLKNNTEYAIQLNQPSSYSYEIGALSHTALAAGASATFTIRPRTGLPASTYSGTVEITSNRETAKLTVQFAVTRPAGPTTFSDVAANNTFAADIAYVSQKGLMGGVGNGNFNPQAPITRGQLVTILYRLEGQPAVSGLGFSDVAAGSYCEKAVKWAAATGITKGNAEGLFQPNSPITREQMATFLYRYNQNKGYFIVKLADLSTFPDSSSVSSYAKDALSWANGTGLVNGTSDGRLNPSGGATRGQAAAILHRYCVSIGR